jgi:hypothetical protein
MHPLTLSVLFLLVAVALVAWTVSRSRARTLKVNPLVHELAQLVNPFDPIVHARVVASGHPTAEVAEAPTKNKLRQIEEALAEKRTERAGLAKARDEARDAFANSESITLDSDEGQAAKEAVRALGECDDAIANLQEAQVATLKMLGKDPAGSRDRRPAGDPTDPRSAGGNWRSDVLASDEVQERLATISASKGASAASNSVRSPRATRSSPTSPAARTCGAATSAGSCRSSAAA